MKINELRVGNIVGLKLDEDRENLFSVMEIGEYAMKLSSNINYFTGKHYDTGFYDNEALEGVLLTEEWLLRADFKHERIARKEEDLDGIWYNGFSIVQDFWNQDQFSFAVYVRHDGEFKSGYQIKYVHQLQNLYHALTGQELVFKSKSEI